MNSVARNMFKIISFLLPIILRRVEVKALGCESVSVSTYRKQTGVFSCKQVGMTLISLMIGIFISMLCILSSLTLYKSLISVATEAKIDSMHDGQLAGAMLTTQLEILSAGYKIDDAGLADVVTLYSADKNKLYWRYNNGAMQCRGLEESAETDGGVTYRVLSLVESTGAGCTEDGVLADMTWTGVSVLGRWPVVDGLANYMAGRNAMLDIRIGVSECTPFGTTEADNHLTVTLLAPSSSRLNRAVGGAMNEYQFCLMNTLNS